MKRILTILILAMMMVMVMAPGVSAASFQVDKTSPEDGASGAAIDNLGVKVFFNEDVYSKDNLSKNEKAVTLIEMDETETEDGDVKLSEGNEIPIQVIFNPEAKSEMMALAVGEKEKDLIKSDTAYKLVISEEFVSADGDALGEEVVVEFRTQNSNTTMITSVVMMVVMVVCMVYFTSRSAKKEAEKAKKDKDEAVNPYKEAKNTGKSVEEIVARENKKKAKLEEKKKRQEAENKKELSKDNFKVSKPKPISTTGSTFKYEKKKPEPTKKQQPAQKKNNKKKGKK